jgi:hypothetical protein
MASRRPKSGGRKGSEAPTVAVSLGQATADDQAGAPAVIARGTRVCGDALETIEACIEKLRGVIRDEPDYDKDLVSHLAWLTVQVVPIMNELRQQAKQALREVSKIPLDTIIAYLKTLPDEAREGIVRDLTGSDAEEPLL